MTTPNWINSESRQHLSLQVSSEYGFRLHFELWPSPRSRRSSEIRVRLPGMDELERGQQRWSWREWWTSKSSTSEAEKQKEAESDFQLQPGGRTGKNLRQSEVFDSRRKEGIVGEAQVDAATGNLIFRRFKIFQNYRYLNDLLHFRITGIEMIYNIYEKLLLFK